MFDDIAYELQLEIIKKLRVKSLIRFRSVSKRWKSMISSYEFKAEYTGPQHLIITHPGVPNHGSEYVTNHKRECVSIIDDNDNDNDNDDDDDTFPEQKVSLTVPVYVKLLTHLKVGGSSRGLFCLFGRNQSPLGSPCTFRYTAVVWNPSIRKSVAVEIPGAYKCSPVVGFGVCPNTSDAKLVKIHKSRSSMKRGTKTWQVEVYTLSSRVWRTSFSNPPSKCISNIYPGHVVVIDGFIYWLADDMSKRMIISFNLTSEEFENIYLPDNVALLSMNYCDDVQMSKLRESLALIEPDTKAGNIVYKVWIMDNGVSKSFTNLFTINLPYEKYLRVVGLRKNGQCIMEKIDEFEDTTTLEVYKPCSKHITDLDIYGLTYPVIVSSYTESLLLLE